MRIETTNFRGSKIKHQRAKANFTQNRKQRLYNKNGYIIADIPIFIMYIHIIIYVYRNLFTVISYLYIEVK